MIRIGQTYELEVVKILDFGAYVDAEELGEVLLPRKHMPEDLEEGTRLNVFLYQDNDERPIVTTQMPKAKVGEFGFMRVKKNTDIGTFLDWGIDKDLFVPFGEQNRPMEEDHSYLVYVYLDKITGRITASIKIDKYISDKISNEFQQKQEVDLIIAQTTDLGYKAIINHSHWGLIYKDEVFQKLSFGQNIKGYIKLVRPDGKIDLSLHGGQITRDKYVDIILDYLKNNDGFAAVHDKSDPKLISDLFGMSKGQFKKAIGGLYKLRYIKIEKDGIHLV